MMIFLFSIIDYHPRIPNENIYTEYNLVISFFRAASFYEKWKDCSDRPYHHNAASFW